MPQLLSLLLRTLVLGALLVPLPAFAKPEKSLASSQIPPPDSNSEEDQKKKPFQSMLPSRPPPRGPLTVPNFVFSPDSSSVKIHFPEGHRDKAQLAYRNLLLSEGADHEEWKSRSIDKNCILIGGLERDPSSRISITGCPHVNGQDLELTIVSRRHSGQYLIKDGKVQKVSSPWSDPRVTTGSLPIPNDSHTRSIPKNRQDFGGGWILRDGDELIQLKASKITEGMTKVCEEMPCGVPPAHELTVRVGYDSSLMERESDPEAWIAATLTHAQTLFYHPSLGSQIKLKILGSPTAHPGSYWRAETSIGNLRQHVTMTGVDTNLYVFFCHDSSYFGTVGIAYVGGLCDTYGYAVSLNEWRNTTLASGKVVAHEMGHNMGMTHDFSHPHKNKGCTGIMDYGESENEWSECSRNDFIAQYEAQTLGDKPHCMKVIEPLDQSEIELAISGVSSNSGGSKEIPDDEEDDGEDDHQSNSGGDSMTNTIDAETVTEFCLAPNWLGDGFCDDENNNAECFYDKLDCCKNRMHGNEFWDAFCTVCIPRQC